MTVSSDCEITVKGRTRMSWLTRAAGEEKYVVRLSGLRRVPERMPSVSEGGSWPPLLRTPD